MAWLRTMKQRFGIAAPRVAIRAHVPWYWRWLGIASIGTLAAGAGWATYDFGIAFPGSREAGSETPSQLRQTIARQAHEIGELRARLARAERQLAMDNATHEDLARQVKALGVQNATLKEDLAFFHTLMPAGGGTRGIVVDRFRVQQDGLPGEYRYRLFLVQTGQRNEDFEGRLQFLVHFVENGTTRALTLPPESEREVRDYQLKFKFFQRIEGSFRLNADAVLKNVQLRVYQQGSRVPKLVHTVNAT